MLQLLQGSSIVLYQECRQHPNRCLAVNQDTYGRRVDLLRASCRRSTVSLESWKFHGLVTELGMRNDNTCYALSNHKCPDGTASPFEIKGSDAIKTQDLWLLAWLADKA